MQSPREGRNMKTRKQIGFLYAGLCLLNIGIVTGFQVSLGSQQRRSVLDKPASSLLMSSNIDMPASRTWRQGGGKITVAPRQQPTPSTTSSSTQRRARRKTKPMPVTGYNSLEILEVYDRRPFQVAWRLNSLGFPLLGWYMSLLMDRTLGQSDDEKIQRIRGEELRSHLVRSKSVALIKVCQ